MPRFRLTLDFQTPLPDSNATAQLIRGATEEVEEDHPGGVSLLCLAVLDPRLTRIDVECRDPGVLGDLRSALESEGSVVVTDAVELGPE